ncbi:MAG: hypothetical protein J7513_04420 [Solirubrobacteraceae bacterium]|nr:hypothetical protein [Solirubrobacteraceae bacterium]
MDPATTKAADVALGVASRAAEPLWRKATGENDVVKRLIGQVKRTAEANLNESYEFWDWHKDSALEPMLRRLVEGRVAVDDGLIDQLAKAIAARMTRTRAERALVVATELARTVVHEYPDALADLKDPSSTASATRKLDRLEAMVVENAAAAGIASTSRRLQDAMLRGPIEAIGGADRLDRADQLEASGDLLKAAEVRFDLADDLATAGMPELAEDVVQSGADLAVRAGERKLAIAKLETVAWDRVERGSRLAISAAHALQQLGSAAASSIEAASNWPDDLPWNLERLRIATNGDQSDDRARLALLELCLLSDDHETLAELTADTSWNPRTAELASALAKVDALELDPAVDDAQVDAAWLKLSTWIDTRLDDSAQGLAWARRGYSLGHRGDIEGCVAAYERAIAAWLKAPDGFGAAADAFFSLANVQSRAGQFVPELFERSKVARALPDHKDEPVTVARQLRWQAASCQLDGDIADARWYALMAWRIYRSVGSLEGERLVGRQLAEVYAAGNEPAPALQLSAIVGDRKVAATRCTDVRQDQLVRALPFSRAPWIRAVSYSVLATLGASTPRELLDVWEPHLIADASTDLVNLMSPTDARAARDALPGVFLALTDQGRPEALSLLDAEIAEPTHFTYTERAVQALQHATDLGLIDRRSALIDLLLDERGAELNLDLHWFGKLAASEEWRVRFVDSAADGSTRALSVLSLGPSDAELPESVTAHLGARVDHWLESLRPDPDVRGVQRYDMAPAYEQLAAMARFVDVKRRERVEEVLWNVVDDPRRSEIERSSALNGLGNMLSAISSTRRTAWRPRIQAYAAGNYVPTDADLPVGGPFSRVRIQTDALGLFGAAAIRFLTRESDGPKDALRELVEAALVATNTNVRRAGWRAMAQGLSTADLEPANGLVDGDAAVRKSALAWYVAKYHRPGLDRLVPLLSDPSPAVRLQLAFEAQRLNAFDVLMALAWRDPDAYIRIWASQRLRCLPSS